MTTWHRPKRLELLRRCRRLSSLRVAKYSADVIEPEEWWRQIADVANEHGIELPTPEQWADAPNVDQWEDLP